jgi:hypothetical protein
MSKLPARRDDRGMSPRQLDRAIRSQQEAELSIWEYRQELRYHAEADRIDTEALGSALEAALEAEMHLLDFGLRQAGGSAAKAALIPRKLEIFSSANNRRIGQRFVA